MKIKGRGQENGIKGNPVKERSETCWACREESLVNRAWACFQCPLPGRQEPICCPQTQANLEKSREGGQRHLPQLSRPSLCLHSALAEVGPAALPGHRAGGREAGGMARTYQEGHVMALIHTTFSLQKDGCSVALVLWEPVG